MTQEGVLPGPLVIESLNVHPYITPKRLLQMHQLDNFSHLPFWEVPRPLWPSSPTPLPLINPIYPSRFLLLFNFFLDWSFSSGSLCLFCGTIVGILWLLREGRHRWWVVIVSVPCCSHLILLYLDFNLGRSRGTSISWSQWRRWGVSRWGWVTAYQRSISPRIGLMMVVRRDKEALAWKIVQIWGSAILLRIEMMMML